MKPGTVRSGSGQTKIPRRIDKGKFHVTAKNNKHSDEIITIPF
jgi:hypothetical protein